MDFQDKFLSSGNARLDAVFHFTAEIDKMTSILRRNLLLSGERRENDAEHSWHIAVMALLFEEYAVRKPNISHAIEMMLVHDLVEIYAGDTFAFDTAGYQSKAQREQAAADKLFALLPPEQAAHIRALWEEFDNPETTDAIYANCLDRLQPFFHNSLTGGHTWKNCSPRPHRNQVETRMAILKDFMPLVHNWVTQVIQDAVQRGWLLE